MKSHTTRAMLVCVLYEQDDDGHAHCCQCGRCSSLQLFLLSDRSDRRCDMVRRLLALSLFSWPRCGGSVRPSLQPVAVGQRSQVGEKTRASVAGDIEKRLPARSGGGADAHLGEKMAAMACGDSRAAAAVMDSRFRLSRPPEVDAAGGEAATAAAPAAAAAAAVGGNRVAAEPGWAYGRLSHSALCRADAQRSSTRSCVNLRKSTEERCAAPCCASASGQRRQSV